MGRLHPILLFLLISISLHAQNPEWINYTSGKYVCTTLVEGDNVWIGTQGGLVKHNKKTWIKTYYNKGNSGLPENWVWSIAVDSSGNKWIGTGHEGLAKYDDTNWTVYKVQILIYLITLFE